jgi:hypothetical protein
MDPLGEDSNHFTFYEIVDGGEGERFRMKQLEKI